MSGSKVFELRRYQLRDATKLLNELARKRGVPYAYWPVVSALITTGTVDPVEIADFLAFGMATAAYPHLRIPRFDVGPGAEGSRIKLLTVSLSMDKGMLEIVSVTLSGVRR